MVDNEDFSIKEYRVFRTNARKDHGKGVMILLNNRLNVKISTVPSDPNARYLKINMGDMSSDVITTITSIFIEPTSTGNFLLK